MQACTVLTACSPSSPFIQNQDSKEGTYIPSVAKPTRYLAFLLFPMEEGKLSCTCIQPCMQYSCLHFLMRRKSLEDHFFLSVCTLCPPHKELSLWSRIVLSLSEDSAQISEVKLESSFCRKQMCLFFDGVDKSLSHTTLSLTIQIKSTHYYKERG